MVLSALLLFFLGVYNVSAFQHQAHCKKAVHTFQLYDIRFKDKYFQLEEFEDQERCTTAIFLRSDKRVEIGLTDGPRHVNGVGNWEVEGNAFKMTLVRKFAAGHAHSDMGQFEYEVQRIFEGDLTTIGGLVGITGEIQSNIQQKVGYFNMIDTTDEREKNMDTIGGNSIPSKAL